MQLIRCIKKTAKRPYRQRKVIVELEWDNKTGGAKAAKEIHDSKRLKTRGKIELRAEHTP